MKKYKLLKDTPTLKAGTIFEEVESDFDGKKQLNRIMPISGDSLPQFAVEDINNFYEWFEEKSDKYKRWRANKGEVYYAINSFSFDYVNYTEDREPLDNELYSFGNYFKTKKEAIKHINYLKALQVIKDDAKGFEPDWENDDEIKYYGRFNWDENAFLYNICYTIQTQGTVYFEFEKDIRESFEKHRKEWLILFGEEKDGEK